MTGRTVRMTLKEARMSRYPEWAPYKKRSWWLLPLVLEEGAMRAPVRFPSTPTAIVDDRMPGRAKSDLSSFECSIEVPSSTMIIILHSNKKEEQRWRASN